MKTKSVIDIVCREISQASPSEQVLLPETIFNAIFLLEKNILYSEQRVYKQCGCFCKATLTVCMSTLSILSQLGCLNIRSLFFRQWTSRGKYPNGYRMWGHISGWIPDIWPELGLILDIWSGRTPNTKQAEYSVYAEKILQQFFIGDITFTFFCGSLKIIFIPPVLHNA